MPTEFSHDITREGDVVVVNLAGELDLYRASTVRDVLLNLLERPGSRVIVDMSKLTFIDSTGLGVLVAAMKRARGTEGDVVLRRPAEQALQALQLTGLTQLFTIEPIQE